MTLLDGINVIEASANGSAGWAGKHFADWGAAVRVLEPPGGAPLRNEAPYFNREGQRKSAAWEWLSRGKSSLDVPSPEGARDACLQADVTLIESELCTSVLDLKPTELRGLFGEASTCVLISPFAADGPYASYQSTDLGITALGGWMSLLGETGREPIAPGRGIPYRVAGIFAFVAGLMGLRHVRQGGAPQFVEVSLQAVAASMISSPWMIKSIVGVNQERHGNTWPLGVMECVDGFVGAPPLTAAHWEMLCRMVGLDDILEDPQSRDPAYRMIHGPTLYERVRPAVFQRSRQEIFEEAQAWRIPAAPVQTIEERLACPQLDARGFWRRIEVAGTSVRAPRVPYLISGIDPVDRGPFRRGSIDASPPRPAPSNAGVTGTPLDGIRVLDLTAFWSGPYATSLLGALGADVIKVESIQRPDTYRFQLAMPGRDRWWESGPVWNDSNCNKRGLTLDLATSRGRDLFEQLVRKSDVVVSNFSNRVMPNLGLTSERLLEINPRIIAVTMPGYGPGGPWENYVGYAIAFEQLVCGSMTGYADGPPSYAAGFCDPTVGMHVVAAIELALLQRERTGRGEIVEVPQCEILDSLFAPEQIAVQIGEPNPTRRGNKHEWMAPHGAYRVSGEDSWITIAVSSDEEFQALATSIGRDDLAVDARFSTTRLRKQSEAALDDAISAAIREEEGVELERRLQAAGIKACRVVKGYDLPKDAGLRHLGFFQPLERAVTGTHPYKGWPFRFSSVDVTPKRPPPLLGEHNNDILSRLLGLSDEALRDLEALQVIGREPLGI